VTQKKSNKTTAAKYCVIANQKYGIYVGLVDDHDAKSGIVKAREVRHVCQYFSKKGGLSSLATYGLCGPRAHESNIGAPAPSATLTGIVNVIECTPEARSTFEAAKQA
jgi:hypothetical protein